MLVARSPPTASPPAADRARRLGPAAEDESAVVDALLARAYAVSPGERFRIRLGAGHPHHRAALRPDEAARLAAALAEILHAPEATYPG